MWHTYLKSRDLGFDYILDELKCDGFFLDTIDSASPWHDYPWMLKGMSDFIKQIREWYPQSIIVANRGLFYYFETEPAYEFNIRTYVNAVMFEAYFTGWDWASNIGIVNPWFESNHKNEAAPHLNREAGMADGFTVICLDYLNPDQPDYTAILARQQAEVALHPNWLNAITDKLLREPRNDVSGYVFEEQSQ